MVPVPREIHPVYRELKEEDMGTKGTILAIATVASLSLVTAACGSEDEPKSDRGTSSSASVTVDPTAGLVGPGCADYVKAAPSGAGSLAGMAKDPVAVAASHNPMLKTLTAAVSGTLNKDVNLKDTLNGGEYTVFAPVDEAFAKLPREAVKTLGTSAGAETLTKVLTYHLVNGQKSPDQVEGTFKTVNGADLTVKGSGDNLTVGADNAQVICGGIKTANATVYLIDSVLMPPSS
jgi:uncharacterized surface protein with fasciclin (FAS1) repeats